MIPFYSRRNQVYGVVRHGRGAVEKHFTDMDDWRRECGRYAALRGRLELPGVLDSAPGLLITGYCPQPTLLSVLEEQERCGFSPEPWRALADWLLRCNALCGELPADGNLRNFLWDAAVGRVIGLDLEDYRPYAVSSCGAEFAAALLTYSPADTSVKRQAAKVLADVLQVPANEVEESRRRLERRRARKQAEELSGIVLAGGASRRMGRKKAALTLLGKTFLQWQVEKLQALGIQDIMVSCPDRLEWPGIRTVPDVLPGRGPLGGLHACLGAAHCSRCLVISVDVPLVPVSGLAHLCRAHTSGATVLRHGGRQEPLIAVYDSKIAQTIQPLIEAGGVPVRSLAPRVPWHHFDYLGPQALLMNCNTPEELDQLSALAQAYRASGLP